MSQPRKKRRLLPSLSIKVEQNQRDPFAEAHSKTLGDGDEWWNVATSVQATDGSAAFGAISIAPKSDKSSTQPGSTGSLGMSPPVSAGSVVRARTAFAASRGVSPHRNRTWDFACTRKKGESSEQPGSAGSESGSRDPTEQSSDRACAVPKLSISKPRGNRAAGRIDSSGSAISDADGPTPRTVFSLHFGEKLESRQGGSHKEQEEVSQQTRVMREAHSSSSEPQAAVGPKLSKFRPAPKMTGAAVPEDGAGGASARLLALVTAGGGSGAEGQPVTAFQSSSSSSSSAAVASSSSSTPSAVLKPAKLGALASATSSSTCRKDPAASDGPIGALQRRPSLDAKAANPFAAVGAPSYRYVCMSRPGPKRDTNEDAFMVSGQLLGNPDVSLYAVFDGHGGDRASRFCAKSVSGQVSERLRIALLDAAGRAPVGVAVNDGKSMVLGKAGAAGRASDKSPEASVAGVKRKRAESDADAASGAVDSGASRAVGSAEAPPRSESLGEQAPRGIHEVEEARLALAIRDSILSMDEAFRALGPPSALETSAADTSYIGAAALIAVSLPSPARFLLAHAGDCRALLVHESGAFKQLTEDHSPGDYREVDRIEKAGGRISDGRVQGVLNMTRSIGDAGLKPFLTAEPTVFVHEMDSGDDWLILASDGLWGKLSNRAVTKVVRRQEAVGPAEVSSSAEDVTQDEGAAGGGGGGGGDASDGKRAGPEALGTEAPALQRPSARTVAGRLLAEAVNRNSTDDVTVLVVDLKTRN